MTGHGRDRPARCRPPGTALGCGPDGWVRTLPVHGEARGLVVVELRGGGAVVGGALVAVGAVAVELVGPGLVLDAAGPGDLGERGGAGGQGGGEQDVVKQQALVGLVGDEVVKDGAVAVGLGDVGLGVVEQPLGPVGEPSRMSVTLWAR